MARPKVHHEDRITTGFRLPRGLHQRLRDAAAERDLSVNFLAVKALEEFLDHLVPANELRLTVLPEQASSLRPAQDLA